MSLSPGTRLGPYEIRDLLGAGGMGEVYRAHDPRLGREVAVKVLPAECSRDADRLRRFEHEAQAAGRLNHPNIMAVLDVGCQDAVPYVVSQLLEGETLREAIRNGLPARKAVDCAVQIAQGLAAAHEKGMVHRDLKPENVFVTRSGLVKILDFGLAKLRPTPEAAGAGEQATATQDTRPGTVLGTAGYMSPEQVRGEALDHRSDIFSLGAILYEMLARRRAFTADTAAETIQIAGDVIAARARVLEVEDLHAGPVVERDELDVERACRVVGEWTRQILTRHPRHDHQRQDQAAHASPPHLWNE